jgi:Bacterial protein of unknown function (DUF899)
VGRGVRRWRSRLPKARCRSELKKGGALRRLRAAGSFHTGAARVLPQGARSIARRRSWGTVISPPRGSCGTPATLRRSSARRAPLHSRDATYARFCQGPYEESIRYRDFMGWEMPWYSAAQDSLDTLLVGRRVGMMHIVCCVRQGSKVFETYRTTRRGVEAMDNRLPVARLDRLRAAGDVGGPADRLATTVQTQTAYPYQRASHCPMISPEGRVFGRPGNRQALSRAYHFLDLPPGAATRSDSTSRWRGCVDTIGIDSFSDPRSS